MNYMPGTYSEIWRNCLHTIKEEVDEESYKSLFEPIIPIKLDGNKLFIQVPNQLYHQKLENFYADLLKKVITKEIGKKGQLMYNIILDRGKNGQPAVTVDLRSKSSPQENITNVIPQPKINTSSDYFNPFRSQITIQEKDRGVKLNPRFTFQNYIEGDCNSLARNAGIAISEKPGLNAFNPLFIYGGVGLGKTHLVQAIGNAINHRFNNSKFIVYVPADTFTDQFIAAVKDSRVNAFTNYYKQVDVLIIEDVQFFGHGNRVRTQDLFFTIFNELQQSGKQLIMTADCAPAEMKGVNERLLSRFGMGLTADIQTPNFETRLAILRQRIEEESDKIGDMEHNLEAQRVIEYLASEITTTIRELEGALNTIIAHVRMGGKTLNLELAQMVVANHKREDKSRKEYSLEEIKKIVAQHFDLTVDKMTSKNRKEYIVRPRQICMFLIKKYTRHTLVSIAKHFGKDHTTVRSAIEKTDDLRNHDIYGPAIRELEKKIGS